MNWDRIEGNWKQFKGQVQKRWGKLTNDHLDVVNGERKALAGRIQESDGVSKDEAERQIDDWTRTLADNDDDAGKPVRDKVANRR